MTVLHGPQPARVNTVALRMEPTSGHDAVDNALQTYRHALHEVLILVQVVVRETGEHGVHHLVQEHLQLLVLTQPLADPDDPLRRAAEAVSPGSTPPRSMRYGMPRTYMSDGLDRIIAYLQSV